MDPKRYSGRGTDHTVQLVCVLSLRPIPDQAVQQSPQGSPLPGPDPTWFPARVSYEQRNGTYTGLPKQGVCYKHATLHAWTWDNLPYGQRWPGQQI